ncbi:aminopeptidase P family protein [Echinicola jeungdonensis]|uniref:Xaa-Pro aminopeptidase n=1 Tax=Echinicola jeungdonensis TaxID=709343 RepID=A0ABV5JAR0_9BACT|nr:aminopeptidase P family protein [Echinicola jeungdonensis]MDN3670549.1 aminopeptidase P family protein [Echinicola jeungdonensis]
MFEAKIYQERRKKLKQAMGTGQLLFLGNEESSRNFKDNWYPFRQDSTFLYYFGIDKPGMIGLIDCDEDKEYLFGNDLKIDEIVWTGPKPTMVELGKKVGIDQNAPLKKLKDLIRQGCHVLPPYRGAHVLKLQKLFNKPIGEVKSMGSTKFIKAVAQQRNIKSPEEIEKMDKAASITAAIHLEVIKAAHPGMKEFELLAVAEKVAREHNAGFSFLPIVTVDGQTLHNHYYGNTIKAGDMVLFDCGAESSDYYAGDMTRTFPVNESFGPRQKELYDIVYKAQMTAIEALKPGIPYLDIHLLAAEKLVEGLKEVGLMRGDPKEAVAQGAHTMFFQCGLGHMMGMDVHDMENLGEEYVGYSEKIKKSKAFGLKSLRLGKELEAGNVVTVEPGIYIIPELIDLFKSEGKFKDFIHYDRLESYRDFGGIRIEDDFLITDNGAKLLGTPLASASEDIEKIRRESTN